MGEGWGRGVQRSKKRQSGLWGRISPPVFRRYLSFSTSSSMLLFLCPFPHFHLILVFFFLEGGSFVIYSSSVSVAVVFVVWLLGYPVGHDAVAKAAPTTTLRAFFPGSQGQPSQMSPADTQLSKDYIPGSKYSR